MVKSEKHPRLDVENPDQRLKELSQRIDRLQGGLVFFGLEHTNKIIGRPFDNEDYLLLRDSILFRASSLLFHLSLLQNLQGMHKDRFHEIQFKPREKTISLLDFREQQIFIFDSIVFHAISLFDYWGNLIDYVCSSKKRMTLKWNGVVNSIRDESNIMSKSPSADIIMSINNDFVDILYGHRSDLIHYKTDLGAAESSSSIMTGESDLVVFAPRKFVARYANLKLLSEANELTLNYVAFWLVEQTYDSLDKILPRLYEHIEVNRKIEKGKEMFFFKPPIKE